MSAAKPKIEGSYVLDIGSRTIRAGEVGRDSPYVIEPNVHPDEIDLEGSYYSTRSTHGSPMGPGAQVEDWAAMELRLDHLFFKNRAMRHRLGADGIKNHSFFFSEPPLQSRRQRDRWFELFFEHFEVPQLACMTDCVLGAYYSARNTALVVDVSETKTGIVPVYEGHAVWSNPPSSTASAAAAPPPIFRQDGGAGRDMTEMIMRLAKSQVSSAAGGSSIVGLDRVATRFEVARDFKEHAPLELCDLSPHSGAQAFSNFCARLKTSKKGESRSVNLPDGSTINIPHSNTGFLAETAEALFQPLLFLGPSSASSSSSSPLLGLGELISRMLINAPVDIRRDLASNVILCGGVSRIGSDDSQLKERLLDDVSERIGVDGIARALRFIRSHDSHYYTWIGGSIQASLSSCDDLWMQRSEWFEDGCAGLPRK